jgi:hypothetical protein
LSEVDFLVKLRDAALIIKDACEERLEKMAPVEAREKKPIVTVDESTFSVLRFEPQTGQKIGSYDVAYEPQNIAENWTRVMNILKANNAVIEKRYHGPDYKFSYWLFGEHKIYRQLLKQP